jgi:gas vesicle protein
MGRMLKKVIMLTGLAALAGYLAGILTAPKSGRETREDLKSAGLRGMSEAEKQLKKVSSELSDAVDEVKVRSAALGDKAGKELEHLAEKAKVARNKAREVLSAIHEGDAEDKDLKEAVARANEALNHIRAYLKK